MGKIQTLEEGFAIFDSIFTKGLCMLNGAHPGQLFTADDYAKFYMCVRDLWCADSHPDWKGKLCNRYAMALRESINIVVVPSIENKKDDYLLVEVLHIWAKWRAMAKVFSRFLAHLPDGGFIIGEHNYGPLAYARLQFRELVCDHFFDKCCDVVISLINNERSGTFTVGRTILKVFVAFSVEMGEEGTAYYDLFEKVLFDDAAKFYSKIALELLQSGSEDVEKVMNLLNAERKRGEGFLKEASQEKLMKVMMEILGEKLKDLDTANVKELLSPALRMKMKQESLLNAHSL